MKHLIVITTLLSCTALLFAAEGVSNNKGHIEEASAQELKNEINDLKKTMVEERDVYSRYAISEKLEDLNKEYQRIINVTN